MMPDHIGIVGGSAEGAARATGRYAWSSHICERHGLVGVFPADADEALVSNEKAADWVRNNVMEFVRGMPEIMVGDVLVAEVK